MKTFSITIITNPSLDNGVCERVTYSDTLWWKYIMLSFTEIMTVVYGWMIFIKRFGELQYISSTTQCKTVKLTNGTNGTKRTLMSLFGS